MKKLFKSCLALTVVLTMIICSVSAFAATSDVSSSHVEFTGTASALSAQALVYSPSGASANLILAVYDGTTLVNAVSATGANDILKTTAVDATGKTVKAFVWADANKEVISEIATYSADLANILDTLEITIDGESFEDYMGEAFDPATTEYEVDFSVTGEVEVPVVTATIGNNAAHVRVATEVVAEDEIVKTVVVEYGERTVTNKNTALQYSGADIIKEVYSYAAKAEYDITFKNTYAYAKDPSKIYLEDVTYDVAQSGSVRGTNNWGRLGGERNFNKKYAKDITLGDGETFKEVTVEAKNASDANMSNSKALSQSFVITLNPTDPEKKGTVIGVPRNANGDWINTNGVQDKVVTNVTALAAPIDDTNVRVSYDEATGITTYGKKSNVNIIETEFNGNGNVTYKPHFYGFFGNDLGRGTGSALYSDGAPITGGMSVFNVPAGYEGVEHIHVPGYGGDNERLREADGSVRFTFYVTTDVEVAVWVKQQCEPEYVKINTETITVETPEDYITAKYQNALSVKENSDDGYLIAYDKYADVIEALLIYNGAIKGVDYTRDANNFRVVNYGMPAGFDFANNRNKFSNLFYLCIKEDGVLVNPATDARIAGKTPEEIAAAFATLPQNVPADGTVKDTVVVSPITWAGTDYGTGLTEVCDVQKFDVSETAKNDNGEYFFGVFPDRGIKMTWGSNTGLLKSYPSIFNIYGADVVRFPLNLVNGSGQFTADWKDGTSKEWINFTVETDAKVMVFASHNYDYSYIAGTHGETGWATVTLDDATEQIVSSSAGFEFKKVSIKEVAADTEMTIYSPCINTGAATYGLYMVFVIPN